VAQAPSLHRQDTHPTSHNLFRIATSASSAAKITAKSMVFRVMPFEALDLNSDLYQCPNYFTNNFDFPFLGKCLTLITSSQLLKRAKYYLKLFFWLKFIVFKL